MKKLVKFLLALGIISILFPMFKAWTGIALYFPSLLSLLLLLIFFNFKKIISETAILFIFCVFFYILIFQTSQLNYSNLVQFIFPLLYLAIIVKYLEINKDHQILTFIALISFSIITIRSLTGIYVESLFPSSARSLTGDLLKDQEYLLKKLGVASYGLCTGMIFIYPFIIFLIKNQKKVKIRLILISFIVLTLFLNLQVAFVTSFIFSILSIITSIFITKDIKKNILLLSSMFVLIYFSNSELVINNILNSSISFLSNNEVLLTKVNEIQETMKYDEASGDIYTRSNLYSLSWNTFLKHPYFGSGDDSQVGGHASWLDFLGLYGIIGTTLIFLVFLSIFKCLYKIIPPDGKIYYLISFLFYLPLGLLKACIGMEIFIMLFLIAPSFYFIKK